MKRVKKVKRERERGKRARTPIEGDKREREENRETWKNGEKHVSRE